MDTKQLGIKCYPVQLTVDMEAVIRKVAKAKLTTTTEAELDSIHLAAKFIVWRLDGRA